MAVQAASNNYFLSKNYLRPNTDAILCYLFYDHLNACSCSFIGDFFF